MTSLKKLGDILRRVNSCWLGAIVTGIFILSLVLLEIFPAHPGALVPPDWFLMTFFGLSFTAPVGLVLAIRDYIWGQRLVAVLGVVFSCWPGVVLLLILFQNSFKSMGV